MKRVFIFIAILLLLVSAGVLSYNQGTKQIESSESHSISKVSPDDDVTKNPYSGCNF